MKKIITLLVAAFIVAGVFAQAPNKMSYQAVIRDAGGALVASHAVGVKVSVLQGSSSGTAVYVEIHAATTNANGLVSLEIGGGTAITGTVAGIDWATGPYFIKTETDPAGGVSYSITGTSELLSVPYALSAGNSKWSANGNDISNTNSGNVGIGTARPAAKLDIAGGNWDLTNTEGDFRVGDSLYRLKIGVAVDGGGAGDAGIMQYGQAGGYNVLSLGAQGHKILYVNGTTQRVGIGTDAPSSSLDVHGSFSLLDGSQGTGKILTSDANGLATWSAGVGFRASGSTSGTIGASTNYLIYGTEQYDDGNGYNFTTGVYTVPVTGVYLLTASAEFIAYSGYTSGYVSFGFETNGTVSFDIEEAAPNTLGGWSLSRSTTMKLTAGTTVKVRLFNGLAGGTLSSTSNPNYSEFSAAKLY